MLRLKLYLCHVWSYLMKIIWNIEKQFLITQKNIFIEAGTKQSWAQYMNSGDVFIGLKSFGLSGPAKDVYEHFQITVDRVLREATKVLKI